MNWQRVRLIFSREILDQLRDRRTLFMIGVLPLILYPSLGLGMIQMTLLLREEAQQVLVIGVEHLPEPALIAGDRFAEQWFESPEEAGRLLVRVRTDSDGATADAVIQRLIEAQRSYEQSRDRREKFEKEDQANKAQVERRRIQELEAERADLMSQLPYQVIIFVPDGFGEGIHARQTGETPTAAAKSARPMPWILYNSADEKAQLAFQRVESVYRKWKREALARQFEDLGLPPSAAESLDAEVINVAGSAELTRSIWSRLLPALLVMMTLTGAFYPAVDLAAGEKERGTMETVLICPASRAEIVLGKFLTIVTFAVSTALLNLLSMGITGQYIASAMMPGTTVGGDAPLLVLPPLMSLIWGGVLLLPIAALFSALSLALATFARSTKEGQYYMTPLLLVTMGLIMFAEMPTVELVSLNSILPVTGVVLLLKAFLEGNTPYEYLLPVMGAHVGYASLAIWWAVEQFQQESVLFREAEHFDPRAWARRLFVEKARTPSVGMALFCFLLIMVLQLGAMRFLPMKALGIVGTSPGNRMIELLIVQQICFIALPAIMFGLLLTRDWRETFRLRAPRLRDVGVGIVLPLLLMPLSTTLAQWTAPFFPPLPDAVSRLMEIMSTEEISIGLMLIAFALAPGICEEIAFRGFILSGFLGGGRVWVAIFLSSFLFGIMHMIPQQAFNAMLVGLVLGLIAVRSASLWPCILFHIVYNGSAMLQQRFGGYLAEGAYPWWLLVVCLLGAAFLIGWLISQSPPVRGNVTSERVADVETKNLSATTS